MKVLLERLEHPLPGAAVTQWFGANKAAYAPFGLDGHEGNDFRAAEGTSFRSMHAGKVTRVGELGKYGMSIDLRHTSGVMTRYAHLSRYLVVVGDNVPSKAEIGLTGNTGRSSAPHLHVSLYVPGISDPAFKNCVDPLLFIGHPITVGSKLGFQCQRHGYLPWLKQHVSMSGARFVLIINPDESEASPFGNAVEYIGRLWWKNEPDKQLVYQGAAGADAYWEMAWPRIQRCPWIRLWLGPNEIVVDNQEQARAAAAFYVRLLELYHAHGLELGIYVFSTGHPELALWRELGVACASADYLVLHTYGMGTMGEQPANTPDNKKNSHHLYRVSLVIDALREYGHRVPPILLTELGVDWAGDPKRDGWQARGLSAEQYAQQLLGHDAWLQGIPAVVGATPFVWLDDGWPSFNIVEKVSAILAQGMAERNGSIENVLTPLAHQHVIPLNPAAALEKAALTKDAGLLPAGEEFRFVWGGAEFVGQVYRHADDRDLLWVACTQVGHWAVEDVSWRVIGN